MLTNHDAAVIFVDRDHASSIQQLPFGALLGQLYERAKPQGPVNMLSVNAGPNASRLVLALVKKTGSTFDYLTCAARVWKELATSAPRTLLIAAPNLDMELGAKLLEAMAA